MAPLLARRPTKMTFSPLSGNVAPGGVAGQTALAPHHDDPTDWSSTSKTKSMCDVSFTRTSRHQRRWSCPAVPATTHWLPEDQGRGSPEPLQNGPATTQTALSRRASPFEKLRTRYLDIRTSTWPPPRSRYVAGMMDVSLKGERIWLRRPKLEPAGARNRCRVPGSGAVSACAAVVLVFLGRSGTGGRSDPVPASAPAGRSRGRN